MEKKTTSPSAFYGKNIIISTNTWHYYIKTEMNFIGEKPHKNSSLEHEIRIITRKPEST